MDFSKGFIITNDMKVEFKDVQLNTKIILTTLPSSSQTFSFDVDKWTEFKKYILAIDKEFYKRFNYQYSDFNTNPDL